MRLALTVNGPGETAGWARPLANALYRRVTYRTLTAGHGTLHQMSDKDESVRKARYNADQVVRELLAASQGAPTSETAA